MCHETKTPEHNELDCTWKMLCDLRDWQIHFNDIKTKYRTLASTWLLASFGGMGFLASSNLTLGLPTEVLIFALGLAASTGLFLLWVLDMLVYHRLLDSCFREGIKLEEKYPSLPQAQRNMQASQPNGQVSKYTAWFYVGTINAPLVFSGALFSHWCTRFGGWIPATAILAIAVLILILSRFVWVKTHNPALEKEARLRMG